MPRIHRIQYENFDVTSQGVRQEAARLPAPAVRFFYAPIATSTGRLGKPNMFDTLVDNWLLATVLAALALVFFAAQLWLRNESPACEKRPSLLSPAELSFFRVLREAVGGDWAIWSLVSLGDLIQVRPHAPGHQTWQSRIQAKRIDFVLCDLETMQARLAIELAAHQISDSEPKESEEVIERALAAAELPLLRVLATEQLDKDALRKSIDERLASIGRRSNTPVR